MVQKSGCYQEYWVYDDERYTHMCYSDLPYLYTGRGLVELSGPSPTTSRCAPATR